MNGKRKKNSDVKGHVVVGENKQTVDVNANLDLSETSQTPLKQGGFRKKSHSTATKTNRDKKEGTYGFQPIFLGARVRLARNLEKFPFPQQASNEQREAVLKICSEALLHVDGVMPASFFQMKDFDELECQTLIEEHQASVDLMKHKEGAGLILNTKKNFSFMINEEDHIRLQILSSRPDFTKLWKRLDKLDTELEEQLEYAFDPHLGYLTACPTNLGTGVRISAMLHLPGLVFANKHVQVARALLEMGMTLRGVYGEQSKAIGHIFQISNQQSLGWSEQELLEHVERVIRSIMDKEIKTRQILLTTNAPELFDNIGRALGVLKQCFEITSEEATNLLSLVILAVDYGFLPEKTRRLLYQIRQRIQPAHLQLYLKQTLAPKALDHERAKLLNKLFLDFPKPDFSARRKEFTCLTN